MGSAVAVAMILFLVAIYASNVNRMVRELMLRLFVNNVVDRSDIYRASAERHTKFVQFGYLITRLCHARAT